MDILMLGWELPPHNSGGLGVACYQMSRALALDGAKIDFVLPYTDAPEATTHMHVHSVQQQPMPPTDRSPYAAVTQTIREAQQKYVEYVEEMVAQKSPDAIHAHDWLTMEAGVRAKQITGAPLIVHVHATEFDRSGATRGNPLIREIEQMGLMMADRVIAVSNHTKALIMQNYGIPADKIEVVHNAASPDDADYAYDTGTYAYLEHLKSQGYTVVTLLTRLTVQKGLTHFMQAAALASKKYDKLVFLIAGDGEQRDELVMQAATLGIADKVFFAGFVRGRQWRDAYNVADIFVLSSVSEPFGLTALEAAAHDTAIILTRQSGVGEVLHSAVKYDFWDHERLADAMVAIATFPPLAATLKSHAAGEYAKLSWRDVARRCNEIYSSARKELAR